MARGEKKKVKGVSGGGSVLGFGVSFGSSWEIDASERKAARQLLTFIEDRRVLFNPVDLEDQRHAEASITEIRGRCTDVISQVDDEASVGHAARAIREACRRFFDNRQGQVRGGPSERDFILALGELRGRVGQHILAIANDYEMKVEDQLAAVLPGGVETEHG